MTKSPTAQRTLRAHPRALRSFLGVSVYICVAFSLSACGSSSPTAPTPQIPNIAGQWTGTYRVTTCTETGSAIGFCGGVGQGGRLVFTPAQTQAAVTGTLGIGAFSLPVSGNITSSGALSLAGSGPVLDLYSLTLNTWQSQVSGNSMTGTFAFNVSGGSPIGTAAVIGTTTLAR